MLRAIPLGGLGEIGLNAMLFEAGGDSLLVDCGLMFPTQDLPGVETIFPDLSYLRAQASTLRGVLLTHAHEDHLGALPYLLREVRVPVYGARFTLELLRHKLEELEVEADLREIHPRSGFTLGDSLAVEPVQMCHSVPDALGFFVRGGGQTALHTGDWKLDPTPLDGRVTDWEALSRAAEEGVTALFSDSTNAEVAHSLLSEHEVAQTFQRLFQEASGRVWVTMFASHISRLQMVVDLCLQTGRRLLLSGRSFERNVELAQRAGRLRLPATVPVRMEDAASLPPSALCVLLSGSQAEPRAALSQLANGSYPLSVLPQDRVIISARAIPGNELGVTHLIDRLTALGAQVSYWQNEPHAHTSGHATAPQQRELIELLRPQNFIPIHGERRHLAAHLETARRAGVAESGLLLAQDGDVLSFSEGRGAISGRVPAGRILRAWHGGPVSPEAVVERNWLAEGGAVSVVVALDRKSGAVVSGPHLSGRGLAEEEQRALPHLGAEVRAALEETSPALRQDEPFVKEVMVKALRRSFRSRRLGAPTMLPTVLKL